MSVVLLPQFKLAILSDISTSAMLSLKLQLCATRICLGKKNMWLWYNLKQTFFMETFFFSPGINYKLYLIRKAIQGHYNLSERPAFMH